MTSAADVVDQLVPEIPDSWFRWPSFIEDYGHVSQFHTCSQGVIGSVQGQIVLALALTIVGRLLPRIPYIVCRPVLNVCLILLGYFSLIVWVDNALIVKSALTGAIALAILIKYASFKYSGHVITAVCLGYIVALEYRMEAKHFASSRGCLMILGIKLSSLAFDVAESTPRQRKQFDLLTMISFLISPATITFGPFINYEVHLKSLVPKQWKKELHGLIRTAFLLVISSACLLYSSCGTELWFPRKGPLHNFATAQSFRFSHYFVCFLAQALSELSGLSPDQVTSTNPATIEFPRSLVQVVVAWNIPMHRYLKAYIYEEAQQFGTPIAMALTFIVSSLFHGLNFQLSAVLLSLGFYCFAENRIRNRLARRLDACVRARPCTRCRHRNKPNTALTAIINLIFVAINVYHLVYLGMVFDGTSATDTRLPSGRNNTMLVTSFLCCFLLLPTVLVFIKQPKFRVQMALVFILLIYFIYYTVVMLYHFCVADLRFGMWSCSTPWLGCPSSGIAIPGLTILRVPNCVAPPTDDFF